MSQKMKIRIFLGISILCWGVIACWAMYTHQQGSAVDPIFDTIHGNVYSSPQSFKIYPDEPRSDVGDITGVAVSNPLNNADSVGETMAILGRNFHGDSLVIVAFGENIGSQPLSGDWGWQGSYGVVQADKGAVDALKTVGMTQDNKTLGTVDDLGMMMDYISYYLPGVSIIPVVLDSSASAREIDEELEKYKSILSQYTLMVVTPQAQEEVPTTFNLTETTIPLSQVTEIDFSGILSKESNLALSALGSLGSPDWQVHIFPRTHHGAGETTEKSDYFSDLQIFCGR